MKIRKTHLVAGSLLVVVLGAVAIYGLKEQTLTSSDAVQVLENAGPGPVVVETDKDKASTPVQLLAEGYNPEAMKKLLEQGHSATAVTAENPQIPLDISLKSLQYLSLGDDPEGLEYKSLAVLDLLLQHGARPGNETKDMLPIDDALRCRVVGTLQKHGHHITAGEAPYNACCVPE